MANQGGKGGSLLEARETGNRRSSLPSRASLPARLSVFAGLWTISTAYSDVSTTRAPTATQAPACAGAFALQGVSMSRPGDREPAHGREDADGNIWFTIAQAAAFTRRDRQTIYSWERRGHLNRAAARLDEHGRRIYNQQQIAAAERQARHNAAAAQRVAA
jgi:hypothetical protein